jgi:hypothetical protein
MRLPRLGRTLLVLYTLINLGGAIYAAAMREPMHLALHVALLLPVGWVLSRRASRPDAGASRLAVTDPALPSRLTNLEQSIDAVAIEVERIVEGQRNLTDLLAEQQRPRDEKR